MSDAVIIQIILGVVSIVVSGIAAFVSIQLKKMTDDNAKKIESNGVEVAAVKKTVERTSIESQRSSEEIDLMKTGAFYRGVKAGQKRESDFQRLHGKASDLGTLE